MHVLSIASLGLIPQSGKSYTTIVSDMTGPAMGY
jgi:hypothetical protein